MRTRFSNGIPYWLIDIFTLSFLIFDFGFTVGDEIRLLEPGVLFVLTLVLSTCNILKYVLRHGRAMRTFILISIVILSLTALLSPILYLAQGPDISRHVLEIGLLFYFVVRLVTLVSYMYSVSVNPATLFVGSFLILAFTGALLLMLPKATVHGIRFTDALFTAVSAVCVTGLIVLDTAKDFTVLGQTIILVLIQLGGLGILTFTSFFAYFFKTSSFKEALYTKDFISKDNVNEVLKMAMRIVVFTLSVELIGAFFIFDSVIGDPSIANKAFFSVFHAISAYCNAGFSTSSQGLYAHTLRYNYLVQWLIMALVVFGGLGYGIASNAYTYFETYLKNIFGGKRKKVFVKRVITRNTQIVLYTTSALLLLGFAYIYLAERTNVLVAHDSWFGKFTTAMFCSVTPRTAGFSTIDFASLNASTLLFVILLMWIGASPASTGGGIKTSTFAIAGLNIFAIARGKSHIELGRREISGTTVNRAFAIICVSLIVIGIAILLLLLFEPGKNLISIVFECFSAYGTVGLSLGITASLCETSKYVLIAVMLIGRVGFLNILIAVLRQAQTKFYRYPEENILIN
ncbi:MAG: potassium transporter TrkG [Flavobacteriales bacterium]